MNVYVTFDVNADVYNDKAISIFIFYLTFYAYDDAYDDAYADDYVDVSLNADAPLPLIYH